MEEREERWKRGRRGREERGKREGREREERGKREGREREERGREREGKEREERGRRERREGGEGRWVDEMVNDSGLAKCQTHCISCLVKTYFVSSSFSGITKTVLPGSNPREWAWSGEWTCTE